MSDSSKRGVRKLPTSASGVIAEMYPQLRDDTARYGAESARELAPELPPAPPVSRVVEDSGWGDLIDEDGDDYVNAYDNSYDIEEEDPEARVVPSLYPKGDPEFNRPIFRKPGEYPSIPVAPANRRPMDMPVMNHAPSQIYEDNPVDYDDWHHPIVRRHGLPPRHEAPGARYDVDAARGEYPDALEGPVVRRYSSPPASPTRSVFPDGAGQFGRRTNTPISARRPTKPRQPVRAPRPEEIAEGQPVAPIPVRRIDTGIQALDMRTEGLSIGSVSCLSGTEGMARSHVAVYIAKHVIAHGGRVLAMITPDIEHHWPPMPGLALDVSPSRDLETIARTMHDVGPVDLVILDPVHSVRTPAEQERIAAVDLVLAEFHHLMRQRRCAGLVVAHLVDRAARHDGVSLHPWMFRDVSCLMDLTNLILMLRTHRAGHRELLVYRRPATGTRVGGLPSFVLPWI